MSRLRIVLLFAALAALATTFAACGGDGDDGGSSGEDPKTVLEDATFEGIESGDLDLSLNVDVSGDDGGSVDVALSGPFQSKGDAQIPEIDMTAEANGSISGEDVDFDASLVLIPSKAFVGYEGTDYEVDPTTFSFIESAIEQAEREGGGQGGTEAATACQKEEAGAINVEDFVENLSNDGGPDVGGTETTKVSGELNVPGAIEALTKLVELPACSSQLKAAGPLPLNELEEAQGQIEKALKSASAEVYVGEDDIVRRVVADLTIEPEGEDESVEMTFDLSINGVNEEQEISTPDDAKPLNALFQKLGVNPLELLQGVRGGGGLGGLLEQFGGAGGGQLPGLGGGSGEGGSDSQSEYLECIKGASTPVDLQNCAKKLQ